MLGTPRERVAELLGSLLLSSLVAVAMTVVMCMVSSYFNNNVPKPEQCAWLLLTTIAGAWTVLDSGQALGRHPRRCGSEAVCNDGAGIGPGRDGLLYFHVVHGRFAAVAACFTPASTLIYRRIFTATAGPC